VIELGVNIDHVATLRQARGTSYPDPVRAALLAENAGADSITLHLREDRRHIQDRDVEMLRVQLKTRMNLEMAVTEEMIGIACRLRPHDVCLVPEKRQELTTEGGLDVAGNFDRVRDATRRLREVGVRVSLFIDPDPAQIEAAKEAGASVIEIHTGAYAELAAHAATVELDRIRAAVELGDRIGLKVNAGHGLNFHNVGPVAAMPEIAELNIGHALVADALFMGWENAVRQMKWLMLEARQRG